VRFAHVTGMLRADPEGRYRILVTLDTRSRVSTVRDEVIDRLMVHEGSPDPFWTVDQFTQETIGTTLAEQGWEAISLASGDSDDRTGPPVVVYLVRML
jgi:hypothetical protein